MEGRRRVENAAPLRCVRPDQGQEEEDDDDIWEEPKPRIEEVLNDWFQTREETSEKGGLIPPGCLEPKVLPEGARILACIAADPDQRGFLIGLRSGDHWTKE